MQSPINPTINPPTQSPVGQRQAFLNRVVPRDPPARCLCLVHRVHTATSSHIDNSPYVTGISSRLGSQSSCRWSSQLVAILHQSGWKTLHFQRDSKNAPTFGCSSTIAHRALTCHIPRIESRCSLFGLLSNQPSFQPPFLRYCLELRSNSRRRNESHTDPRETPQV